MTSAVRIGRLLTRTAAQGTPIAGVLGETWSPAGGLILYWVESVLVLGATLWLLARWTKRHGSPAEAAAAGIRAREVALVHGGAFGIFGLFLLDPGRNPCHYPRKSDREGPTCPSISKREAWPFGSSESCVRVSACPWLEPPR